MSYPKYYCPECKGVSKCIGYRYEDGINPLHEDSYWHGGYRHVYIYECENDHRFEYDSVLSKDKIIVVNE